jgi:hypothetical protein
MKSDDLKFVLDVPPPCVVENVIFAPGIGFPRLSDEDGLEELSDDVVVVVCGVSTVVCGFLSFILGIFGMVIVNWPAAKFTRPKTTKRLRTPANFMSPPWVFLKCQMLSRLRGSILQKAPIINDKFARINIEMPIP